MLFFKVSHLNIPKIDIENTKQMLNKEKLLLPKPQYP